MNTTKLEDLRTQSDIWKDFKPLMSSMQTARR